LLTKEEALTELTTSISPQIYYVMNRPLKEGVKLPVHNRNKFYSQSETYGYHMTIIPEFDKDGV